MFNKYMLYNIVVRLFLNFFSPFYLPIYLIFYREIVEKQIYFPFSGTYRAQKASRPPPTREEPTRKDISSLNRNNK